MKSQPGRTSTLLLLSVLILFSISISNCAYITGEAIETSPTPLPVINNIPPVEANQRLMFSSQWIDIIDVGTPQEYAQGHLNRAINIDLNSTDFKEKINKLDKNATYLVYCRTGVRSAAASKIMLELGFKDIYNMTGGISAWETVGLPVEK